MACEGTNFSINLNYHYYILQKHKSNNKIVSLNKITNGNVNVICYDLKDAVPPCLMSISQNYYNTLSPLHIPMEEHDNITDENNQIKIIEFYRSVSIGTQDTTYDYDDEFWDSI